MNTEPYNNTIYAETYNDIWVYPETIQKTVDTEIKIIERILKDKQSWLDVACGTGYHLQNTNTKAKKHGVDISSSMLAYADKNSKDVTYYCKDVTKGIKELGSFDLVSNLGFGYVHQKTLFDVLTFFKNIASVVAEGGDLLIGYDNPFSTLPKEYKNVHDKGVTTFKALIWDYKENETGIEYKNCISPHKDLIADTVKREFEEVIEFSIVSNWKPNFLLFKGKRKNYGT